MSKNLEEMKFNDFEDLNKNVFAAISCDENGKIVNVPSIFTNFRIMCASYDIEISYDIISKEIDTTLDVDQNGLISTIESLMILNGMDHRMTAKYIDLLAEENPTNKFKNTLDRDSWDGVDRLNDFYNTVIVDEKYKEMRDLYLLKSLQQMLYLTLYLSTYKDSPKFDRDVLILYGNKGCGKSSWIKSLLPKYMSDYYIGYVSHLNTHNDKVVLACIKKILVELEDSFKPTTLDQFKGFFGKTTDEINMKYLRHPVRYPRTTSFIGTMSDASYLKHMITQNRYLILPVHKLNGAHGIDMLQLYKQIIETVGYVNFQLTDEDRQKQRVANEELPLDLKMKNRNELD